MLALGMKNSGLHQSVVMLTGTITFLFIKSCTAVSAPSLYRSGTRLPVTFLGIALGFRLMRIGSPFIGSGLSSSLNMSSNSDVNSFDSNLTVVQKQNSSMLFNIVFGNPCDNCFNSLRCLIPQRMSSRAPLSFLSAKLMSALNWFSSSHAFLSCGCK